MAIPGYKCLVKVSGDPLTLTDEPTTASVDFITYQITDTSKRVLHPTGAITVKVNAIEVTSGYTLNRLFGKVIFDSALLETDTVTVSGQYLPLSIAAEAYELSYSIQATNADATRFQDTWTKRKQTNLDASGSFQQWYLTADMAEALMAGNPIVVEYQVNNQIDLRAWALLTSTEPSAQAKEIQTENIQWEGTADANGRVISNAT